MDSSLVVVHAEARFKLGFDLEEGRGKKMIRYTIPVDDETITVILCEIAAVLPDQVILAADVCTKHRELDTKGQPRFPLLDLTYIAEKCSVQSIQRIVPTRGQVPGGRGGWN